VARPGLQLLAEAWQWAMRSVVEAVEPAAPCSIHASKYARGPRRELIALEHLLARRRVVRESSYASIVATSAGPSAWRWQRPSISKNGLIS
jgi:hypothetical protein